MIIDVIMTKIGAQIALDGFRQVCVDKKIRTTEQIGSLHQIMILQASEVHLHSLTLSVSECKIVWEEKPKAFLKYFKYRNFICMSE